MIVLGVSAGWRSLRVAGWTRDSGRDVDHRGRAVTDVGLGQLIEAGRLYTYTAGLTDGSGLRI